MTRQSCIICGVSLNTALTKVQDPDSNEMFLILQCKDCQLEVTYPQPDNIGDYYTKQYHGNRHGFTAQFCVRRRLRWINQFHPCKGKLLDIGCGEGTFLLAAKKSGWDIYGTEINSTIATSQNIDVRAKLDDMKLQAPFDCITLWHSLEHMSDPMNTIKEIHTLLAPNGTLFIAVPNAQGLQSRCFGKNWLHRDVPRHLYHFSQNSLLELLRINGFESSKIWHQEFEYDMMGWIQSTLNCLFMTKNIFFHMLTGRRTETKKIIKFINLIVGVGLSIIQLPLLAISSMLGSGGTLIVAAKKSA